MKKKLISLLVLVLIVSNTLTVQAATTKTTNTDNASATTNSNTTKVSLDNIEDVITENNSDIKILFNKMKIANKKYRYYLDQYQDYDDEFDDDDEVTKPDSSDYDLTTSDGISAYNEALEEYEDYEAYTSSKSYYETYLDEYNTAKDNYESGIADEVKEARTEFVTYLSDVSARKLQENVVTVQQRDIQKYKLQYEQGFLSKNEYTASLPDITTANNTLTKLKNAEDLAKSNLCTALGFSESESENVEFSTDIEDYLEKVSQIKYDDDLDEMLDNNIDIRSAQSDIDDLEDDEDDYEDEDYLEDVYDYTMENDETTLKQTISTAKSNFKEQYDTLISSYNTVKSDYDSLNVQKTDYSTTQVKYNYGFASKNDLEDAKIGDDGLDSVNSTYENDKTTFYNNYLRYLQMKEGY